MSEQAECPRAAGVAVDEVGQALRSLGARAHQLRAALRAADHYIGRGNLEDSDTASWLIAAALDLAQGGVDDLDSLARTLQDRGAAVWSDSTLDTLRAHAGQLLAATRAIDHFLEQEASEDRETGSWLIATALGLASRMAASYDDSVWPERRPNLDKPRAEHLDPVLIDRTGTATAPLRGAV